MSDPLVVATAADRRYALPLAVMLRSIIEHAAPERELHAFVLADGIEPELRRRVERPLLDRLTLHWVEPPDEDPFRGLPLWGRMPATTYFKLRVTEIVPDESKKALWLDPDIVVLADLGELWERDLADDVLLAVRDPFVPSVSSPLGVAGYGALGLDPAAPYFNAGVMLVDLERWARDCVVEGAYAYLERFRDRVFFHDQEALNAALCGAWGPLEERWNRSVSAVSLGRVAENEPAAILHFSGTLKPWRYHCPGVFHRIYYRHLDRTDWAGWRPDPSLRGSLLHLYQASGLRRLAQPLEQRWFRWSAERSRHTVGHEGR